MTKALDGLHVIDRSDTIAGQFCARLMADFGADVVLEEPEGGSPTRSIGPFDEAGRSLAFLHLNTGKRTGAPGCDPDAVICAPAEDPAALRVKHPNVVAVKITAFGDDGPMAGWSGPEIVLQAASGMMNSNGTRGREPLYGVGNRAAYAAGLAAYIQALVSLRSRRLSGAGDTVRIDAAETAAAMCFPYVLQHIYNGTDRRRGDQDIPAGQVQCRGAWVCLWVYSNRFERLCRAIRLEHCLNDPRFAEVRARAGNWPAFFELVQAQVGDRDPDAFVAELQRLDIIAARAYRPSELRASAHLSARGYWRRVRIGGVEHVLLGPAFGMSRTPAAEPAEEAHAAA
jgi:crotonobetainyl-CoA:carnitine CoA-transferase CaiB-like acyl-CoA transferase